MAVFTIFEYGFLTLYLILTFFWHYKLEYFTRQNELWYYTLKFLFRTLSFMARWYGVGTFY